MTVIPSAHKREEEDEEKNAQIKYSFCLLLHISPKSCKCLFDVRVLLVDAFCSCYQFNFNGVSETQATTIVSYAPFENCFIYRMSNFRNSVCASTIQPSYGVPKIKLPHRKHHTQRYRTRTVFNVFQCMTRG